MAIRTDFDPRKLIESPEALAKAADGLNAAGRKHQMVLHRQRVGAARAKLRRAVAAGASPAEVTRLRQGLERREIQRARSEAAFHAANIAKPAPNADTAQVLGVVTGEAQAPPLTAALVGDSGETIVQTEVQPSGGFVLAADGGAQAARVQVSDAERRILYRDAEPSNLEPGTVSARQVALSGPIKQSAPAPTQLTMPDLIGQTEDAACAILFRLGVREIDVSERRDAGTPGLVLDQAPKTGAVLDPAKGAKLTVSVRRDRPDDDDEPSDGRELDMPDFVGLTSAEALRIARRADIAVRQTRRPGDAPAGEIIAQDPTAGMPTMLPAQVLLTVSTGAQEPQSAQVTVPSLVGLKIGAAEKIAQELDLRLARRDVKRPAQAGTVLAQNPAAGVRVTQPATVTVQVGTDRKDPGPVTPSRPRLTAFAQTMVDFMALDDRLANAGVDASDLAPMIETLGIRDQPAVEQIIALDNAALQQVAGLENRTRARSLRALMKRVLAQME